MALKKFVFTLALVFSISGFSAQILNLGNGAEPQEIDPHKTTGIPEFHIAHNLFEPLVSKDPKTLEPVPGAAESWTKSKDGKTYTFKLRKNGKWSNGEEVTAEDYIYSWTRLLKPETAAEYAYQGYYFKNGEAFNKGKITDASQLGFKAKDKYTLEVTLERPVPFFIGLLYHHSLYPVPRKVIEKHGKNWTRPENIVTNGAFKISKWEINKVISVVPNEHYWDKARIKLTQANFFPIEKTDTEEKMFRAGELHLTNEIPLEKIPTWQKDKTGVYQNYPYNGIYFYWFNFVKAPTNNKKLRQALMMTIDRKKIVTYVTKAGQQPALAFTPPGAGGFVPRAQLNAEVTPEIKAKAKKLLAEAGYPDGKGLPPIELLYNTHDGHKKIAEAIQQMWKENLGVDIKLFNQEWKVYLTNQNSNNFQMSRAGWIGDYNDPNTFLDMLMTGNGNNKGRYSNPEFDKAMEAAAKEQNLKKRMTHFQKAEDILLDDAVVLPIYVYTRVYLKDKRVEGWYPNIEDIHPLKYVSLKE